MNYINRLKAIYQLMILGDKRMIDELRELDIEVEKITPDELLKVRSLIELMQTNIEVYLIKHKGDNADENEKEEFNFLATITRLSNFFKRQIPREIVVTEFVALMEEVKEVNKYRKNGRSNEF